MMLWRFVFSLVCLLFLNVAGRSVAGSEDTAVLWKHVFPGHPHVGSGVFTCMTALWDNYFLVYKDDLAEGYPAVYFSQDGKLLHRFRVPSPPNAFAAGDRTLLLSSDTVDRGTLARVYNRNFEQIRRIRGRFFGADAVFVVQNGKRMFGLISPDQEERHLLHVLSEGGVAVWSVPLPEHLTPLFFIPGESYVRFLVKDEDGVYILTVDEQGSLKRTGRTPMDPAMWWPRNLCAFLDTSTLAAAKGPYVSGKEDTHLYLFDLKNGHTEYGILADPKRFALQQVRRISDDRFLVVTLYGIFIVSRELDVLAAYKPEDGRRTFHDALPAMNGNFIICGREAADDNKGYAFIAELRSNAFVKVR
jgi:hypothetical protein